jgi:hypothetical protein
VNKSVRVYQEMRNNLHEIEGWARDAGLIPIGWYFVCHGTWAAIPVRNSGEDIGTEILRISEVHGTSL